MKPGYFRHGCMAALLFGATAHMAGAEPVERSNSTAVWFEDWGDLYNATLVVSGPDGWIGSQFAPKGTPVFHLQDARPVVDGIYRFELNAATTEKETVRNPIDNGRGADAPAEAAKPFYLSGFFTVSRGVIVPADTSVEDE